MSSNDNGQIPTSATPEDLPVTATPASIHSTTDTCEHAVLWALVRRYDGLDLDGFDGPLVSLASRVDGEFATFQTAVDAATREAALRRIESLVLEISDASPPSPIEQLSLDDVEWEVILDVDPERVIETVCESFDRPQSDALATFLGGASKIATDRLYSAIESVTRTVVCRQVHSLGFPTHAARKRGVDVDRLEQVIRSSTAGLAAAAAETGVESSPDVDWVSQLACAVEATASEAERGGPNWGSTRQLAPDERFMASVAARIYLEALTSGVADAVSTEEALIEQIECAREWDPDAIATDMARVVIEVLRARGVPITEGMQLATMTRGQIIQDVAESMQEIDLEKRWPELERERRRSQARAARSARKAERDSRRRGTGS